MKLRTTKQSEVYRRALEIAYMLAFRSTTSLDSYFGINFDMLKF